MTIAFLKRRYRALLFEESNIIINVNKTLYGLYFYFSW